MKTEAAINKKSQPYMFDFFNIKAFYQPSNRSAEGSLHKIFNALVEALNAKAHLPKYLIVIPDRDLILQAGHFNQGLNHILDKDVLWLTKQIDRAFTVRREDLKTKCSVAVGDEPKIIWIKMIPRPLIKNHIFQFYNNVVNLRKKFNNCLEDILAFTRHTYMIDPCGIFDDYDHFDNLGNLTANGRSTFWKFLDSQFKKFDRDEIDLLPAWKAAASLKKSAKFTRKDNHHCY